jgi:hypothetical protein
MAGGIAPGNSPGENDIRGQLDRILADPLFQRSPQLSAILRFIIEEKLAGRGGEIKESVIAREVLGCSASFDPHTDPRVRIRVRWLRSKLTEYYQGSGSKDSVGIEVPKGGYKPRFFWRQPTANPADAVPKRLTSVGRDEELNRLRTAYASVCSSNGVMVAISGEGGIGKTTLAEDFLASIELRVPPPAWVARSDARSVSRKPTPMLRSSKVWKIWYAVHPINRRHNCSKPWRLPGSAICRVPRANPARARQSKTEPSPMSACAGNLSRSLMNWHAPGR